MNDETTPFKMRKLSFVVIPVIVFCIALIGGYFTGQGEINWYYTLKIPAWAPAGNFIGAMWSLIYIATAISILYVWHYWERHSSFGFFSLVIFLFVVNGFLNVLWSYLFFAKHLIGAAVLETAVLEVSTLALVVLVRRISILASILLIPYALWVLFAQYLIFVIWKMNG